MRTSPGTDRVRASTSKFCAVSLRSIAMEKGNTSKIMEGTSHAEHWGML